MTMASFVPIIKDLVPLVMPSSIHITRAKDLQPPTDAPGGKVSTSPAISGISGKLSASSKDPTSLFSPLTPCCTTSITSSFRPFSRNFALIAYLSFLQACAVLTQQASPIHPISPHIIIIPNHYCHTQLFVHMQCRCQILFSRSTIPIPQSRFASLKF